MFNTSGTCTPLNKLEANQGGSTDLAETNRNSLEPGCYYKQASGKKKAGCIYSSTTWTRDTWGKRNADAFTNEAKCKASKTPHDAYCGSKTEWKFVSVRTDQSSKATAPAAAVTLSDSEFWVKMDPNSLRVGKPGEGCKNCEQVQGHKVPTGKIMKLTIYQSSRMVHAPACRHTGVWCQVELEHFETLSGLPTTLPWIFDGKTLLTIQYEIFIAHQ